MAHWISSKLKAAETLLHQIDKQAAESLGKNDKPQLDGQLGVEILPKTPETKPLIKDQLKKKVSEKVVYPIVTNSINAITQSNSDIKRNDDGDEEGRVSVNLNENANSSKGLTDSDWTELLSVPDKRGGKRISDKKVRSSRPGLNLSAVGEKSGKGRNNGPLKSWRTSNVELGISTYGEIDEKPSSSENVTPRLSSVQSTSSGGELDQGYNSQTLVVKENDNGTNVGKVEVNDTGRIENSLDVMAVSHQRKLGRTKSGSGGNGSKTKKVDSLASDGESNTDTSSSSGSESEREREERRKRRQQILAEKAAAKAVEAIKERENFVAKLEGEKQSLEKILEERAKQHVKEASELQTTMMETMEAVELEKQKHNNTRMEALSRLAKLESSNADLARSLANVQKNLEIEVNHVAELRQQIHLKEATVEELRREISLTLQHGDRQLASRGVEFEMEMLKADYSFLTDEVGRMQEKVKTLETSIEITRRQIEDPTQVEIELKRRLGQLTDHLIQKQAQVETLSSEKATLHFRIEAVSRMIDENKSMTEFADFPENMPLHDSESGVWQISDSNLKLIKQRMQSGQQHLGSLVRQLDSLYCTGAVFLRRNLAAKIWSLFYLVCLHVWVMYILMSHSPVSDDNRSRAAVSLENINNTGGSI